MMTMMDFKYVIEIHRYFKLLAKILGERLWSIHINSTCREQSECAKRRVLLCRNSFSYSFFKLQLTYLILCNVAQKSQDNV